MKDSVTILKEKRTEICKKIKQQEKSKIHLDTVFDENKQLKQERKAVRKANNEAAEKIKRLKTAQLVQYKKERDEAINTLKEQKKQYQDKLKQQKIKEKEEKIQQQKQQSVSLIQKWYRRQHDIRKRSSLKILIFKCEACDKYSDEELNNRIEELRHRKRKYFLNTHINTIVKTN